jgi:hypothetical protein
VIAIIGDLQDGCFPFFKTHRLFLLDYGVASCDFNRNAGTIEAVRIAQQRGMRIAATYEINN